MSRLPAISSPEAAERLGVNPARVRQLLGSGGLEGERIGGHWLISEESVRRRLAEAPPAGRPLSPRMAWGVIRMASGEPAPWLSVRDRSLVRARLRREPRFDDLAPSLRHRARVVRVYAHSSALSQLAGEPGVVRGGVSASGLGVDLVDLNQFEAYVADGALRHLDRKFRLREEADGNVILRVIPGIWPFSDDDRVASPLAVALDLYEAGDERSRRAARDLVRRLVPGMSAPHRG